MEANQSFTAIPYRPIRCSLAAFRQQKTTYLYVVSRVFNMKNLFLNLFVLGLLFAPLAILFGAERRGLKLNSFR